jgi:hypothetical protein
MVEKGIISKEELIMIKWVDRETEEKDGKVRIEMNQIISGSHLIAWVTERIANK